MKLFVLKPLGFRKLCHSSEMRNDALMRRGGLNGLFWSGLADDEST